jgi:4-hydroxybenzoate polyprenyltransferase
MLVRHRKELIEQSKVSSLPLVVDFDRGLLSCDLGMEAAFALAREKPLRALGALLRFTLGRASAVPFVEMHQPIDVASLPYNAEVLALVEGARKNGRPVYLVSSRHRRYATAAAEHLGLFDAVAASARDTVCAEASDGILRELEAGHFDFVGDAHSDLWARARNLVLVNPTASLESEARVRGNLTDVIRPQNSPLLAWVRALRLHQWLKNLLVLAPLLASHRLLSPGSLASELIAFLLFGCCASSVYLLNDLFDLRDDRHHPTKRNRPFASGRLPIASGLVVLVLLLVVAFAGSTWFLPPEFTAALGAYYFITLAYSLALKRVMMLDVVLLAVLYTLRMVAGTFAFGGELTFWMLAFSMFIFFSLALAKRYGELRDARLNGRVEHTRGRGYVPSDLEMISAMGAASGLLSVMVLAFYIQDEATMALYRHPKLIWFACPLLLFWVGRTWMLTHRGDMHDDPVVFAITDKVSLVTGALFGLIFALAA